MSASLPFQVTQTKPTVTTVRLQPTTNGWEQWFLLRADAHHDNTHCRHDLELKHLRQAQEREAGMLDFGDLFCAMQGQWDKRADMNQFRPELRRPDYLSALIDYNSDFYRPFAANFTLLTRGNHEDSVLNRHHIHLTDYLGKNLRAAGSPVQIGLVQGWVRFLFTFQKTKRQSFKLRYHHGYGGGGPVTKDTIQANRQMVFLDDVDFVVSGHTHDSFHVTYRREGVTHEGFPYVRDVECIKCPGYKDEYSPGEGWAVHKGHPPKPLGAWWLRFFMEENKIQSELIRAK